MDHGVPGGTAGGCHIGLLGRDLLQKVLCLFHSADVGTNGHLDHVGEAQLLNGGAELGNGHILAELAGKGRGGNGVDLVPLHDGADHLIDLALVYNGSKGAGHQALAAGHTLVLVDDGLAVFIGTDGIHAAGGLAGALHVDDGVVVAGLSASAALDALAGVNVALAVDKGDGISGAYLLAGGSQAVLAVLRHLVLVGGAGMAGIGNDVDEGGLVVLLGNGGLVHPLGQQAPGLDGPDRQAHGQPDTLTGNGTLQKHGFPVQGLVAGNNHIGQILSLGVVITGVGHPGHLRENLLADVCDQGRNSTHSISSIFCCFGYSYRYDYSRIHYILQHLPLYQFCYTIIGIHYGLPP